MKTSRLVSLEEKLSHRVDHVDTWIKKCKKLWILR